MAKTMVGMVSPFAAGTKAPAGPASPTARATETAPGGAKPNLAGTMIGMPSPVRLQPGAQSSQATAEDLTQTRVGVGSPDGPDLSSGNPPPQTPPQSSPDKTQPSQRKFGQTMMGVAQPGIAPAHSAPNAELPPQHTAKPEAQQAKKFQGTLLGIAQPGIAPSPQAPAPPASQRDASISSSVPRGPTSNTPTQTPSLPPPRPMWQNALFVGLGLSAAAGIGGLAAALGSRPVQVLVTEFSFDEQGRDQLKLSCKECPDGSILSLDEASATFQKQEAILHPKGPLSLGRNELQFQLQDTQGSELKVRPVILPIAYRYRINWDGRHEPAPFASVIVNAPAGSNVQLAGETVELSETEATYRFDLSKRTLGETSSTVKIEESVDLTVTSGDSTREAKANLRQAIAPLQLTSVGRIHQLTGKAVTIHGRTAPEATATGFSQKVQADKDGKFTLSIENPLPGKHFVRAFTQKLVARRVPIELVKSAPLPKDPVSKFSALKDGADVLLTANVLESRITEGVTRTLLEIPSGCTKSPCLVRGVFAEPRALRPNRRIRVQGDAKASDPFTIRISRFR